MFTDNTQAMAAVNEAASRLPQTREVLWRLAKLGLEFRFEQVDCCSAESCHNLQRGCAEWFSAACPMQAHVAELAGKVLWANLPCALADLVLHRQQRCTR